ncbi:MAG: alpha/beta hydrolase [Planctomycetaceae bacterium]|nr:alpha/beta hydrolase [Planctomycetaceae bacterium]
MRHRKYLLLWAGMTALLVQLPCEQAFAAQMRVKKNVVYFRQKQSPSHDTSLDIYAPNEGDNHPVVIWVHGGAWKYGDKADVAFIPSAFTSAGYVLVSVNYRLYPRANFRQQASDVASAVKWVKKNIEAYAGDKNQVFLMGHSAGAHLSALIGTDEQYLKKKQLGFKDLKGIILLDGACYHVADHIRDIPEQLFKDFFIKVFGTDQKKQKQASPVKLVSSRGKMPPFLVICIANRKDSMHQSESLTKSIKQAGGTADLLASKSDNHLTLCLTLGMPRRPATEWGFEFLNEATKPARIASE